MQTDGKTKMVVHYNERMTVIQTFDEKNNNTDTHIAGASRPGAKRRCRFLRLKRGSDDRSWCNN
eukprot:scaffold3267_cov140-Cylindrotheca_fusiformis.AAC.7